MKNKGFTFALGKNANIHGRYYNGYPLEALLYDALMGDAKSRRWIYSFFRESIQQNGNAPSQVQEYVAYMLGRVADGEIAPNEILFPNGNRRGAAKIWNVAPCVPYLVNRIASSPGGSLNGSKSAAGAFESAGQWLGSVPRDLVEFCFDTGVVPVNTEQSAAIPESTVRNWHYAEKERIERLEAVQLLLDKAYSLLGQTPAARNKEILGILGELDFLYNSSA